MHTTYACYACVLLMRSLHAQYACTHTMRAIHTCNARARAHTHASNKQSSANKISPDRRGLASAGARGRFAAPICGLGLILFELRIVFVVCMGVYVCIVCIYCTHCMHACMHQPFPLFFFVILPVGVQAWGSLCPVRGSEGWRLT